MEIGNLKHFLPIAIPEKHSILVISIPISRPITIFVSILDLLAFTFRELIFVLAIKGGHGTMHSLNILEVKGSRSAVIGHFFQQKSSPLLEILKLCFENV